MAGLGAAHGIFVVAHGLLSMWHADFLVAACMRDLVPWPGIEPKPPALGAQSLTHWTTREVPKKGFSKHRFVLRDMLSLAVVTVLPSFILHHWFSRGSPRERTGGPTHSPPSVMS